MVTASAAWARTVSAATSSSAIPRQSRSRCRSWRLPKLHQAMPEVQGLNQIQDEVQAEVQELQAEEPGHIQAWPPAGENLGERLEETLGHLCDAAG